MATVHGVTESQTRLNSYSGMCFHPEFHSHIRRPPKVCEPTGPHHPVRGRSSQAQDPGSVWGSPGSLGIPGHVLIAPPPGKPHSPRLAVGPNNLPKEVKKQAIWKHTRGIVVSSSKKPGDAHPQSTVVPTLYSGRVEKGTSPL